MKSKGNRNLFWLSYADLMTSLFVITMVLFVLSYKLYKDKEDVLIAKEKELRIKDDHLNAQERSILTLRNRLSDGEKTATALIKDLEVEHARLVVMEDEYLKLQEIQKAIEALDKEYFVYQPEFKRHILKKQVQFDKGKSFIKQSYHNDLRRAGEELLKLVSLLENDSSSLNIKYLLVIEGQSSKDNYELNHELSYERALALFRLWQRQGISFDPDRVEIQISGSGDGGVGRDMTNESKNQRFLIQILPKIGELEPIPYIEDSVDE